MLAFACAFTTTVMLAVIVLAAPGDLDTTFNSTGKVTTDIGGITDFAFATALQPHGKIIVAWTSFVGLFLLLHQTTLRVTRAAQLLVPSITWALNRSGPPWSRGA